MLKTWGFVAALRDNIHEKKMGWFGTKEQTESVAFAHGIFVIVRHLHLHINPSQTGSIIRISQHLRSSMQAVNLSGYIVDCCGVLYD